MPLAIKIENVSKRYRLGQVGTGTLSHDLSRAWAKLRGKEDPTLKVTQLNDRTVNTSDPDNSDYVWALNDINLEIERGEVLGIIGPNGAGKSTLLKLLSRVTAPTTGSIKTRGRIASLLEVGTGFHPELTGRENIYLNGAILGMRRHEVTRQLDAMVDFSGCAKYLDTPVKRYSSGMMVRLGFAVAAHLECEILIVDEVLAVGDAQFQSRCLGKLEKLAQHGRTVLFVTHQLQMVRQLCNRAIIIESGTSKEKGDVSTVVSQYLANVKSLASSSSTTNRARAGEGMINLSSVSVHPKDEDQIRSGTPLELRFNIINPGPGTQLAFTIYNKLGIPVFNCRWDKIESGQCAGATTVTWTTNSLALQPGEYFINTEIRWNGIVQDHIEAAAIFTVTPEAISTPTQQGQPIHGSTWMNYTWA